MMYGSFIIISTMIITLFAMTALLSLVHYTGSEEYLVTLLTMPLEYYLGFMVFLVVARLVLALIRVVPTIRVFYRSLLRMTSRVDEIARKVNNRSGPNQIGQVRKYSTSSQPSQSPFSGRVGRSPRPIGEQEGSMKFTFKKTLLFNNKTVNAFFKRIAKLGSLVSLESSPAARNGRPRLSSLFSLIGFRMFSAVFGTRGKYTSRILQLWRLHTYLLNMVKNHGSTFTVKYLKACRLAIAKAVAGTPLGSLNQLEPLLPLPRLSRDGLPKFIPVRDRRLIILGQSVVVIRWWTTLYSVYRVIYIVGTLKLSTITDPLTVPYSSIANVMSEVIQLVPKSRFDLKILKLSTGVTFGGGNAAMALGLTKPMHAVPAVPLLETASATSKVSWQGFISDAAVLARIGQLDNLVNYFNLTGRFFEATLLKSIAFGLSNLGGQLPITSPLFYQLTSSQTGGKLALKEESAGKIRVFAMVDVWTQWALKGLHEMLFKFLKGLPNDGTFDQHASVRRCQEKAALTGKSFGYDLSAATDRLPLMIQKELLNHLKPNLGNLWADILVGRGYYLSTKTHPYKVYHYAVGQPMGALSSWAMLAVTHHLLAQCAYFRALKVNPDFGSLFKPTKDFSWYFGYEVLGDDIVFFDKEVAIHYLDIMAEIGVPINLSKSVIGENPTFEFAKVLGRNGDILSEVSWAMFMAQPTLMGRVGIAFSMIQKGFIKENFISYLTALSRESRFDKGEASPFLFSLAAMLVTSGKMKFATLLKGLDLTKFEIFNPINFIHKGRMERILSATLTGKELPGFKDSVTLDEFARGRDLRIHLIKTIDILFEGAIDKIHVKTQALNPHKDALLGARSALLRMLCKTSEEREQLEIQLENLGVFRLDKSTLPKLSNRDAFLHMIFAYLFEHFFERLSSIWLKIAEQRPDLESYSIDQLIEVLDELDRYKEIIDISARADDKLSKKEVPLKNTIESPLDVFRKLQSAPLVTEVSVSEPIWDWNWDDFDSKVEIVTVKVTPQVPVLPETWDPMSSFNDHFYCLSLMQNIDVSSLSTVIGTQTPTKVDVFDSGNFPFKPDPFSVLESDE
nr:MAG: RNA-dependent RNA polymerase [Hangzhou mito-like virus 3]